jgi:hypothetical protein
VQASLDDLCNGLLACTPVGDRETETVAFPPSTAGVRAGSHEGSTAEGSKASSGTPTSTNTYGGGVINSGFDFTEICPPSVRHNARMKFEFEILKSATVGYQDIQ